MLGDGPNQVASPLLPYDLRTVDGTDNNLVAGQSGYGSASREFPRQSDPEWRTTSAGESYQSVNTSITDNGPRFVSNVLVDQSQTYSSHSSHQVFLREYALNENGDPVSTGELIEGEPGGMATWAHIKEQARTMLGLELSDVDVADIPKLATDQYGRFLRGPNGLPQYETATGRVEGNLAAPVAPPANFERIGIAFLDDIGHTAGPFNSQTGARSRRRRRRGYGGRPRYRTQPWCVRLRLGHARPVRRAG